MRIALHVDGPRIRGNERQAILLAEGLLRRGHRVLVSCRSGGDVADAMDAVGAEVTATRPRGDLDLVSAALFAAWLRRSRADGVLVTSWKRAIVAGAAGRAAGIDRVVLRLGGLRGEKAGAGSRARRAALRSLYHAVIANSPHVRDQLVHRFGVPSTRVRVIRNGIAVGRRAPGGGADPEGQPGPWAGLGIPEGSRVVLTVSGLERNKGADLLPAILALQPADVHFVVAGAGTADQVRALTDEAARAGVAGRLHLLGHRSDVPALLSAADLFLLPSRSDSLPNAMLEAMAAGVPVVVTDVGGVDGALGPAGGRAVAGWVAPVGDAPGIARTVREALAATPAEARVREAAWRAANWFCADRMAEEYEAVLTGDGRAV